MKIRVFKTLAESEDFEFEISSVREIFAGFRLHKGQTYVKELAEYNFKYILIPKEPSETNPPLAIVPEVMLSDISLYEELWLVADIEGEIPAAAVAAVIYGAGAGAAVAAGTASLTVTLVSYAIAAVINIAISMALNMVMSLLSPTKEFSSDPAAAQHNNSNLFNGAPLVREQGGSMPLAFGEGFAGGVLISSSLSTTEG